MHSSAARSNSASSWIIADDLGLVARAGPTDQRSLLHSQRRQDGSEFRCGLGDFVVGIGFGDDTAAGLRARPPGGRRTTARRGWPPPTGRRRGRRTSPPRRRRSRGRPRVPRSGPPRPRSARRRRPGSDAAPAPDPLQWWTFRAACRGSGVDRCHSAAVRLSWGSAATSQVGAQRFERGAHGVDDELVFVPVLAGLGQCGAAGGVGLRDRPTGEPIRRTAGRSPDRRSGRPAARGWRPPARCRRTPSPAGDRSARYAVASASSAIRRRRIVRSSSGPSATSRSARASTTLCKPLSLVVEVAQCRCDAGAVFLGGRQRLGDPHRAEAHAVGQAGSASPNVTDAGGQQRGPAAHVERQAHRPRVGRTVRPVPPPRPRRRRSPVLMPSATTVPAGPLSTNDGPGRHVPATGSR